MVQLGIATEWNKLARQCGGTDLPWIAEEMFNNRRIKR
jgi:hypothetical protein